MYQDEQAHRMPNLMMKYFQEVSCVQVALYLINNESKGWWQWEENKKGDKYLTKMPIQGFCKIHNSNQRILLDSSSIEL